jgi:hypothetical protein
MSDPSLSVELRFWVMTHLRFDGAAYVFSDGQSFENVRAAVRAAWLAGSYDLALEIAQRYDIHRVMCVRCTQQTVASKVMPSPNVYVTPRSWHHVCEDCNRALIEQVDSGRADVASKMFKASIKVSK